MDMDAILASVSSRIDTNAEPETAEVSTSEPAETSAGEATEVATSAPSVESEKPAEPAENPAPAQEVPAKAEKEAPETSQTEPRKAYHRSTSNDLSRAQYSAQKWQKKYKRLKSEYDAKLADFQKYKDLDASKFDNDEDKQQYLAWKASRQQNLSDLQDTMTEVARSYEDERREREAEIFNDKVERIYGSNADRFRDMEDEWGRTFEVACNTYDPHNVIRDYVRNSPLGPAIKNVIYNDSNLQTNLFERSSGNPMIDASNRLNLLKSVERTVYNYLNTPQQPKAPAAQTAQPAPAQPRKLPHLPPRKATQEPKPQVTGSLTKSDVGGNMADNDAEIAKVYHSVFG